MVVVTVWCCTKGCTDGVVNVEDVTIVALERLEILSGGGISERVVFVPWVA